jgi:hypothetical protein
MVAIFAFGALFAIQSLKWRPAKHFEPPDEVPKAAHAPVCITYRSTPQATWRCSLHALTHHWPLGLTLALVPVGATMALAAPFLSHDLAGGLLAGGLLAGGTIAGTFGILAVALRHLIHLRFPTPDTLRICTSCLTTEGFKDTTPDGVKLRAWNTISSIRQHKSDLYFRVWFDDGHLIPREAWKDDTELQAFYQTALLVWQSNGREWPE